MAKYSQDSSDERPVLFYENLTDIINEVPAEILNADESEGDDEDAEGDEDETAEGDGAEGEEDADPDKTEGEESEEEDDDDNDDYFTKDEDEADTPPKPVVNPDAPPAPAVVQTELAQYVLSNLTKIPVSIVVAGADGKDVIQNIEVYGVNDLPENFKGYASPLAGERFRGAVTAQEVKARALVDQFTADKQKADMEKASQEYATKENKAIAEDLTELRKEGIFPKFKGNPGTKEFNDSEGAKEFDRTVAFMNKKNDEYIQRVNSGKNYRHIGFREAFEMLHGQNPKAAEQAEDKARKKIAGKVVSKRGTRAQTAKTGAAQVSNLTDLADEFQAAVSN